MPPITRMFIKTGFAYVVLGVALSALWIVHLVWPRYPLFGALQPTALHLIVVGWLTQVIFGVALWMFPPWSKHAPRGPGAVNWACYSLLNAGILLRLVAEPWNTLSPHLELGSLLVVSAVLQVIAVWLFVAAVWTRVRSKHGGR